MEPMTNRKEVWDEDPIILFIVFVSITITLIGDCIKCLLTIHLPRHKQLAITSQVTNGTPKSKTRNQQRSHSMNAVCDMEGQKKVVGTTSKDGQLKQSASSLRSKPFAKQSNLKKKQGNFSEIEKITSDGTNGVLASATVTPRRSQSSVPITSEEGTDAPKQRNRGSSKGFASKDKQGINNQST